MRAAVVVVRWVVPVAEAQDPEAAAQVLRSDVERDLDRAGLLDWWAQLGVVTLEVDVEDVEEEED